MGSEKPITRPDAPTRHRITVAELLALDEAGFFDDSHVELIEGEIFEMSPLHINHGFVSAQLVIAFGAALDKVGGGLTVLLPVSAHLEDVSLPEADIIVAKPAADDTFVTRETVRILVEVSASSLRHHLGRKLPLYAGTRVPEYWVADVRSRRIIRFSTPVGEDYAERAEFAFGAAVPSATVSRLTVDTARLA